MLAEFDALEDGSRTLYGEWVVGRRTWQRLQTEWHAARTSEKVGGATPLKQKKETVILYIHGGTSPASILFKVVADDLVRCILPLQRCRAAPNLHTPFEVYRLSGVRSVPFQLHVSHQFNVHPAIDYRLAPETKFPGPLHDVVSTYLRLVEDLQIPAANIVLAGDSAGGGLTTALLLYLRDNDYPLPSGAILMSPWVGEFISWWLSFAAIH